MKITQCPFCGKVNELHHCADEHGADVPIENGDASICITCGNVAVYDSSYAYLLRLPRPEEEAKIDSHPEVIRLRLALGSYTRSNPKNV